MRIVTMCTLAFAICGDRVGKTSETVPSKTSMNRRWLAKSLLLGASVHAASGFLPSGVGRPARVRALEPLRERIEDEPHAPGEDSQPMVLKGSQDQIDELLLSVMLAKGLELLTKINDEISFQGNEAEWKAVGDDVREFKKWQEDARGRYHSLHHKLTTPVGIRALETLKGAMHDPVSKQLQAQREVKAAKISDLLDAAEHDISIAEDYDPSIWGHFLQTRNGKQLQNLWQRTTLESAWRDTYY